MDERTQEERQKISDEVEKMQEELNERFKEIFDGSVGFVLSVMDGKKSGVGCVVGGGSLHLIHTAAVQAHKQIAGAVAHEMMKDSMTGKNGADKVVHDIIVDKVMGSSRALKVDGEVIKQIIRKNENE